MDKQTIRYKSQIDTFSHFHDQQRKESERMEEALIETKQACEAETGAVVEKNSFRHDQQDQRLLEQAINVSMKALKEEDVACGELNREIAMKMFEMNDRKSSEMFLLVGEQRCEF